MRVTPDGEVWFELRPRVKLILYYGILAPRAASRSHVVAQAPSDDGDAPATEPSPSDGDRRAQECRRAGAYQWADLMRRTCGFEVLACPRCGGRLRLTAVIEHASVVQRRILGHLGLPRALPEPRPARPPPISVEGADLQWDQTVTDSDAAF